MDHPRQDETLSQLLSDLALSVLEPEHWQQVLQSLCSFCGATKAMISRRRLTGAEFIVPTSVAKTWQSPLIFGFNDLEIRDFLENYLTNDPWTNIEAQNRPYYPYAISSFLPVSRLKQTDFWQWLAPQNLTDCVVVELEYDTTGWTALNLYLDQQQAENVASVISQLSKVQHDVSKFWNLGRDIFRAKLQAQPWTSLIDQITDPIVLIDTAFVVTYANQAALALQASGLIACDLGHPLQLPVIFQQKTGIFLQSASLGDAHPELHLWDPSAPWKRFEENSSGELIGQQAIVFSRVIRSDALPLWEQTVLNEREKQLVELIAKGGQVKDGAQIFGISVRANAEIWRSAKQKLGGLKKQDLQARFGGSQKDEEK